MYMCETRERLTDEDLRVLGRDLGRDFYCPITGAGVPTEDGRWIYFIDKELDVQADKPVLVEYGLVPWMNGIEWREWDTVPV